MSSLKERIAALNPAQRRALALKLEREKSAALSTRQPVAVQPRTATVRREGEYPLSENQWSMWTLHAMSPTSSAYHVALTMRIRGICDTDRLQRGLDEIADRHGILRTTYGLRDHQPIQRLHARLPIALGRHDVSGLSEEKLEQRMVQAYAQPFDLEQGPVWRAELFSRAATKHLLLLVIHHIATDLWSIGMIMGELQALLRADLDGKASMWTPPSADYVDYTKSRLAWSQGQEEQRVWHYWRNEFTSIPESLEIPSDFPRPSRWSFRGASLPFRLGPDLAQGLKAWARREEHTLYSVLLAGFAVLIGRYSGSIDFVCGAPLSGRTEPEFKRVAGYFVNFAPLRIDLSGDPPFSELVKRIAARVIGAIEHQGLPFHRLCEGLGVTLDPSRPRLAEVEFSFDQFANLPGLDAVHDDLHMELHPFLRQQEGQFAINLMLVDVAGDVSGALRYCTDLYSAKTMMRFASHLRALYTSILRHPDLRISQLNLLSEAEKRLVLEDWNQSQGRSADEAHVHEHVTLRARTSPDALAITDASQSLTYARLEARSNQLARSLCRHGVGPESRVVICLDRGVNFVVAALAVLKAGGAYVPVDPRSPPDRISYFVADSRALVVIGTIERFESLPAETICIDPRNDASFGPTHLDDHCQILRQAHPSDAAYVIYTSGSTGKPKGVVVEHRQLNNLVHWHLETYKVGATDRIAQIASPGFDAAVWEIWPALVAGAALLIPDEETRLDAPTLATWLEKQAVTSTFLPTSLCESLLEQPEVARLPLRFIVTGGDRLRRRPPPQARFSLYNHYGPTETTVVASAGLVTASSDCSAPSIGRAITNVRIYVLDSNLEPQPIGVPGELYVGGAGVARGYLGRADLTAQSYLPDPHSPHAGARMYRTGDRVRWREDGELDFLGRVDFQIKIRGQRIEPGEIENAILKDSRIREALVVACGEGNAASLVAYFVADGPQEVDRETIRARLVCELPEACIPTAFVALPAFPLSVNGKVDRSALPAPDESQRWSAPFVEPRPGIESVIAGAFASTLGLQRVGRDDDFFALGGHSLLATSLLAKVRQQLSIELSLRALFVARTPAALALHLANDATCEPLTSLPPIVPVPGSGPLPLSYAQQRLWFIESYEPGTSRYNLPVVLSVRGRIDRCALERSITALVSRHEPLRTLFDAVDGEPVQRVGPPTFRFAFDDLRTVPRSQRKARAWERVGLEVQLPFDLHRGPLLRVNLLQVDEDEHVLALTTHHIASDGWSTDVLLQDLFALYDADRCGEQASLPILSIRYADYAAWQRACLGGAQLEKQITYWCKELAGAIPFEFDSSIARAGKTSHRAASVPFAIDAATLLKLDRFAQSEGVTSFMLFLAAWFVVLHRWSGQDDICVGTPIAGRHHPGVDRLVGFFVNTLVIRAHISDQTPFREFLAQVKDRALGAFEHQDLPFDKVVEAVQPERLPGRSPLFQVMFALQRVGTTTLASSELHAELERLPSQAAKFDLTLQLSEGRKGMTGEVEYATELLSDDAVERLVVAYQHLLAAVAEHPLLAIGEAALVGPLEKQKILTHFSRAQRLHNPFRCAHEAFADRVRERPHAIALSDARGQLTYSELDRLANQLAHRLCRMGVGREDRVAIWMPRSRSMVVSMLATLKAGAAYVPLDDSAPATYVGRLIAASEAKLVLRSSLDADSEAIDVARLDVAAPELAFELDSPPDRSNAASDAAYLIYTSGSTGAPKGVVVEHRNLSHLIAWHRETYTLDSNACTTQVASVSFDAAVWEIWPTLCAGARLVIIDDETRLDPQRLAAELIRYQVTHAFLPTSLCEALLVEECATVLPTRFILTGGDRLRRRPPKGVPFALVNHYGPTEITVVATAGTVEEESDERRDPSIGRPIPNTSAYLLTPGLEVVPVGFPGELYVGGAGVARGYLGQAAMSAERYLPDPFTDEPGARMYRTGDRARWRADGTLEFLGRADLQFKVQGQRIDPAEIESTLLEEEAVADAVVTLYRRENESSCLVAYVVAQGETTLDGETLRQKLALRLPQAKVPAQISQIAKLPLTASGKVDRRALPPLDWTPRAQTLVAPLPGTESAIATEFSELLGGAQIGRDGDFFALGGHSLLAMRLISRLRTRLGIELSIRAIFEHPTVRRLALHVESSTQVCVLADLVHVDRHGELAPSFAQRRMWFMDRMQPGSTRYNLPLVLRIRGDLDLTALERALGEIVRRHEVLRTNIVELEGEPRQRIAAAQPFLVEHRDLACIPAIEREQEAKRLILREIGMHFDLAHDLLFRALIISLDANEQLLVLHQHHIASDGWSIGILIRELAALYSGATLPELPFQYADYAAWQNAQMQNQTWDHQIQFWKRQLLGAQTLDLPCDKVRPAVQSDRGALLPIELDFDLSRRIREFARERGATPFMVLLSAWNVLLARLSGQDDICVGTPVAGRRHAHLENLIGLFVNTLVMRAKIRPTDSFVDVLTTIKENALNAFSHQDLPFEKLVEAIRPDRDVGRTPLFQVFFALFDAPVLDVEIKGLEIRREPFAQTRAKFDLSLLLVDDGHRFSGDLEYATDLFESESAQRVVHRFVRVLNAALRSPEQKVSAIDVLLPSERQVLLHEWGVTKHLPTPYVGLVELFERQVDATPSQQALIVGERVLTYLELERASNRLASGLRARGVGPEVLVALCLPRSVELVVAVLGILKAGGAYVPLDPTSPRERLAKIYADSKCHILITHTSLCNLELASAQATLWIDSDETLADLPADRAPIFRQASDLAYVLYTSGSSGSPKGVAIENRSAVALIAWAIDTFGPHRLATVAATTSLSFDLSVFEIFAPLACGGRVLLADHALALLELAHASEITLINTVPSAMAELVQMGSRFAKCKTVNLAGEALPAALVSQVQVLPALEDVFNLYGPTEDTTYSTWTRVQPDGLKPAIGRPLPGTSAYVLNSDLDLQPIGVPGELYLGGVGLARAYLNHPSMTASSFVPDPFSPTPGARMYRTGDLVRWRNDGQLEYLGRLDFQVKLRGFRIELGEVEAALCREPGIREAVVVTRGEGTAMKLVAYIGTDRHLDSERVKEKLAAVLPGYMVPNAIVVLPALPLTSRGKIDRGALPMPVDDSAARICVPPSGPLETEIAAIFRELLGLQQVGAHDDFFALGGHSLAAVRLLALIKARTGRSLPLARLFTHSTVSSIASLLDEGISMAQGSPLILLSATGNQPSLYVVHGIGGSAFVFRDLSNALGSDTPTYAFQAPGLEDKSTAVDDISALAKRYLLEIVGHARKHDAFWISGWSFGGLVAIEMTRQALAAGLSVAGTILIDSWLPAAIMDAAKGDDSFGQELLHIARELGVKDFAGLTVADLASYAVSQGVLPDASAREILDRALAVHQAHHRALRNYRPLPLPATRVILLRAQDTNHRHSLDRIMGDSSAGWNAIVQGGVEIRQVAGDHFSMLRPPHVESLSALMRDVMHTSSKGFA
jgi:amino acid adenylation domain-containing protein